MKERITFLLAGQSNMVGAGSRSRELPESYRTALPVSLFEDGEWRALGWRDSFGPEIGFAHTLAESGRFGEFLLCKVARGGANLYYDWNPDGISTGDEDVYRGPLFPQLTTAIDTVRATPGPNEPPGTFGGLLWMQGERDSLFAHMADAYEERLQEFIAAVRGAVGDAELPVVIAGIAPRVFDAESMSFKHPYRETVRAAQRAIAASDEHIGYVETIDLPQNDNLHFDTGGQLELGRRFAFELIRLLRASADPRQIE